VNVRRLVSVPFHGRDQRKTPEHEIRFFAFYDFLNSRNVPRPGINHINFRCLERQIRNHADAEGIFDEKHLFSFPLRDQMIYDTYFRCIAIQPDGIRIGLINIIIPMVCKQENRKIAAQESEYRAGVDRQKNFNDELAEQSKTDYAGMGGLIGDDLGGELVGYKKKKYGLIGV